MSDPYRRRARSPTLSNPARSSLPGLPYGGYSDRYVVPTRRDILQTPRSSGTIINAPIVTETTYKIKPDPPGRHSSVRDNSRTRRSTLDSTARPQIVAPEKLRHTPHVHGGSGRPASPLSNPYRSSDEGGEYYTMPASSSGSRGHRRQAYSTTMDNADLNRLSREREGTADRLLRVGSGKEGQMYPSGSRSRQVYPGTESRRKDSLIDDYGPDGYGYTNPKDLVQYDLNRTAPRYPSRRDSYEGGRPARPSSITGYQDVAPRIFDTRERGPPPSTRGFDKIPARAPPAYDAAPIVRMPMPPGPGDIMTRSTDPYYDSEQPRRSDSRSRRPVSIYHEHDRRHTPRDDYYIDPRDEDLRDRRDKSHHAQRYDDGVETRGFGLRTDRDDNGYDKKKDHEKKKDYELKDDYADYDDDHDRKSGRGKVAAGLSLAGAALGVNASSKSSRDNENDEREEPRRRRDGERRDGDEQRRRREPRDDRDTLDLAGRDPKERHASRDDRDLGDDAREAKDRTFPKEDKSELLDLSGRNPQERPTPRDERATRDDAPEPRERRRQRREEADGPTPESSDLSHNEDDSTANRARQDRSSRPEKVPAFNPKDTMDLRALKDALNKQDSAATAPPMPPKEQLPREPTREGSFERKKPRETEAAGLEPVVRDERGRRDRSVDPDDRRPLPRLVSPPRGELKKVEDKVPVKGILRQPRERFPEDPAPIREGVAPMKGATKDGVPPDKRWTKIDRRLVNPDALEAGKERYEARDDFVIVLRVLSKEEIQAYAVATQQIRAAREEREEREERDARRRRRRDRHERHQRERHHRDRDHDEHEYDHEHRRHRREREEKESHSESDTTEDEAPVPKMIESREKGERRRVGFDEIPRGSLAESSLREDPAAPGTYSGYTRNPPRKDRD